jgi:hypothetical protein
VKKLLGGCLVVLALLAVGASVVTFYLYSKGKSAVSQFAEFGTVPDLEKQVHNKAAFTPPAGDLLTADQVERLLGVQKGVRDRLGARFADFERKYDTLLKKKSNATALDAPELVSAYRDLAGAWMDGKRAQVDALNQAGLSLDEYRWVRGRAYAAIGLPVMDIDVGKLVTGFRTGGNAEDAIKYEGAVGPAGPEQNKTLVEPHRKELEDNAALAMFGL